MTKARVLAVLAIIILWPSPAHAARGFWAWLEELSGPGSFDGPMYAMPIKCWHDGATVPCGYFKPHDPNVDRNETINRTFEISFGVLDSGDRPRFKDLVASGRDDADNHRKVIVVPINGVFLFRPHRSLDIGPGAGVLLFFGDGVEANPRLVLIPVSATWKPLLSTTQSEDRTGRLGRMLGLEFQASYITKGFTGADFGSTQTTYRPVREVRATAGISLDFREW
jgi:hypothetical protein